MEDTVSKKAKSALHNLHTLSPKFAFVLTSDGVPYEKAIREITIGEKLLVKHGEVVPLDGQVIEGISSVNLVHLTGESLPVSKTIGDLVPAGARNLEAALTIKVNRISSDSTLARIIQLITEAQDAKPQLQRMLDRFGKHYATTVIALTFFFAIALPLFGAISYFGHEGSIYRALAFLIAASPCALIIATPTAYLSAISACARRGILLKGGITLDALASCSIVAFDKTGTLTTGELICTAIEPFAEEALSIAYGLERQVTHPIANAICKLAISKGITPAEIHSFKAIAGFGLEGMVGSTPVLIGLSEEIVSQAGTISALLKVGDKQFLFHFSIA